MEMELNIIYFIILQRYYMDGSLTKTKLNTLIRFEKKKNTNYIYYLSTL